MPFPLLVPVIVASEFDFPRVPLGLAVVSVVAVLPSVPENERSNEDARFTGGATSCLRASTGESHPAGQAEHAAEKNRAERILEGRMATSEELKTAQQQAMGLEIRSR